MSSSNKVSKKRRTVAASGINVSDGVKQYINESGWLTVIVAALLHCVSSVVMYTVESFDGGGFLCVFQPVATAALCVGLICSFVGARLRFFPIGITMVGLIIVCVSLAMLFVIGIISLFSEYSALGFIQQLLAVVTIIASFTAALYLLLSGLKFVLKVFSKNQALSHSRGNTLPTKRACQAMCGNEDSATITAPAP